MSKEEEETPVPEVEDRNASQSSEGPACADDKQGGVPSEAAAKKAQPPRKRVKKVMMETPPPPTFGIYINDPLFFAGLNVMHRKAQQEIRKTKLSSLPII